MGKKRNVVVCIAAREASLKRKVRRHLRAIGFQKSAEGALQIEGDGKNVVRALHSYQRTERLKSCREFIEEKTSELIGQFASGREIDPCKISPVLERISAPTSGSDLFRLAALTWSVPVSNGFGRRLRYLVRDKQNGKLIGIIAIGDPVFNLGVRDQLIGWNAADRSARLVNIMDAYVLGALPPYNMLLGGKMVACLLRSRDVYNDFTRAYGNTTGIISKKEKRARLLAITTTSSMGRSSVYNRLRLNGTNYLNPIGYTGGWGHFHIPDRLFLELRSFLREIRHPYADLNRFGQGPNWRMRTTREALDALGFNKELLRHGIQREVFMCELASNAKRMLRTGKGRPDLKALQTVDEVAGQALERWILPRASRRPEYREWEHTSLIELLGRKKLGVGSQMAGSR